MSTTTITTATKVAIRYATTTTMTMVGRPTNHGLASRNLQRLPLQLLSTPISPTTTTTAMLGRVRCFSKGRRSFVKAKQLKLATRSLEEKNKLAKAGLLNAADSDGDDNIFAGKMTKLFLIVFLISPALTALFMASVNEEFNIILKHASGVTSWWPLTFSQPPSWLPSAFSQQLSSSTTTTAGDTEDALQPSLDTSRAGDSDK